MKLHYKNIAPLALVLALASCQDDEVLNLEHFPANQPQISIDGEEGNSIVTVQGTYQHDGSLLLDGLVTRDYTFNFSASPEEASIHFEVINKNIPAELVNLSQSDVVLPAGFATAKVTVELNNEDFSFATPNYEEETYELGVRAIVKGYQIAQDTIESKVIINKEAYSAACYVESLSNSETYYHRTYAIGKDIIMEEKPIEHKFLMKLDKPARQDVKVKVATKGIKDAYGNDVTVTPSEILIKAGNVVSDTITWSINNNFLLEDDKPTEFDITLNTSIECGDNVVYLNEEKSSISLEINKTIKNMGAVEAVKPEWTIFSKEGWEIEEPAGYMGNPYDLIDGKGGETGTGQQAWVSVLEFIVDMKEAKTCTGFGIDYMENPYNWGGGKAPAAAMKVQISTSDDKEHWTSQGVVSVKELFSQYVECFAPVKTQYLKFTLLDSYAGFLMGVTEIYVYGNK